MRPFIWRVRKGGAWFVTMPRSYGFGWPLTTWPGTDTSGYVTLGEAVDATLAALATSAS